MRKQNYIEADVDSQNMVGELKAAYIIVTGTEHNPLHSLIEMQLHFRWKRNIYSNFRSKKFKLCKVKRGDKRFRSKKTLALSPASGKLFMIEVTTLEQSSHSKGRAMLRTTHSLVTHSLLHILFSTIIKKNIHFKIKNKEKVQEC